MTVKVKYDLDSSQILGYFPDFINYKNNLIDKDLKEIDGYPYIEITDEEWEKGKSNNMIVSEGVYQEYIESEEELLQNAQESKKLKIEQARQVFQYSNITIQINGEDKEFIATLTAQTKLLNYLSIIDWTVTQSINWRLADSITFITMSQDETELLINTIIARELSAYQQESAFLTQIANCSSVKEVEDVKINFS